MHLYTIQLATIINRKLSGIQPNCGNYYIKYMSALICSSVQIYSIEEEVELRLKQHMAKSP